MNWIAAATKLPTSWNWYDYIVAVAVLSGFYSGLRAGLVRSVWRVVMWGVMTLVALLLFATLGAGLHDLFGLGTDSANLQAFLIVTLVVYVPCHFAGNAIVSRVSERRLPALVENVGGVLVGPFVMVLVMAWLSIALALTRSPLWHEEAVQYSCFGSRVVQHFPSIAATTEKKQTDKLWFMEPIKRREDPTADGDKSRR
jgi:uncharacterized membrane protein required for colicin V production